MIARILACNCRYFRPADSHDGVRAGASCLCSSCEIIMKTPRLEHDSSTLIIPLGDRKANN